MLGIGLSTPTIILSPRRSNVFSSAGERVVLSERTANLLDDAVGFIGAPATTSYNAYGHSAKKIPAGMDGYVEMDVPSSDGTAVQIALDVNSVLQTYGNSDYYAYVSAAGNAIQRGSNSTTPVNTTIIAPLASTTKVRLERRGTTLLVRLSKYSGDIWRTIATYSSGVPTGDLYVHLYCSANSRIYRPTAATRPFVTTANIVADGNSLTKGSYPAGADNDPGWPERLGDLRQYSGATIKNFAVSGQTTAQMIADAATQIDGAKVASVRNIIIAWEIRNHLFQGGDVAGCVNSYWSYLDARRAAGYDKVVAVGVMDCDIDGFGATPGSTTTAGDNASTFRSKLTDANALIAANWQSHADAFVDIRSNANLQPITSTYSFDGTHLYTQGYSIIRDLVDAQIRQWL